MDHAVDQCSVALFGEVGVGKTALTYQFVLNYFPEACARTLEEVSRKKWVVDDIPCWMEVIDTDGQPDYASLQDDRWIRAGHGLFLIYSITSRASFDALWQTVQYMQRDKAPLMLLGNKCDNFLDRAVSTEEATALASHLGCPFLEVSAKTTQNVDRAFADLVRLVWQNRPEATTKPLRKKRRKCVVL
ncbi:P-loop containing nucleoside triphosphate hydrolase protein [Mycena latifolia]|nr:P-loop containing nucleoside triphosphate hydrolase protein [Mycena latifolia]